MKRYIIPIAAAVGIALASAAANAQLPGPAGYPATSPTAGSDGLFVALWESGGTASEIVNLGNYGYNDILPSTGNLTPNAANSNFSVQSNPTGAAGDVLQLNFGTIPNFSDFSGTLDYGVYAAINGGQGSEGVDYTSSAKPTLTYTGVDSVVIPIQQEIGGLIPGNPDATSNGQLLDLTESTTYNVQGGPLKGGKLGTQESFFGAIGTALSFYNELDDAPTTRTQYANATGNGFWFLSSSGDLTFNVPYTVSAVPLPAAVWLLASGLAGLGAVARRRRVAAI